MWEKGDMERKNMEKGKEKEQSLREKKERNRKMGKGWNTGKKIRTK